MSSERVQVFAADAFRESTGNVAPPPRRLVFMQTMGCQMNISDSEASGIAVKSL